MRLKLKEGAQRELIYQFKIKNNFSWQELAINLKTKVHILNDLVSDRNLISEDLFKKLNGTKIDVIERKPDNWGKIKCGKSSTGKTKRINYPPKSAELAELIGIILGDGNIHYSTDGKKTSYSVRIAGDATKEIDYLNNYVKELSESLFAIKGKIVLYPKQNEIFLLLNSKKIVNFFVDMGLKIGNKIQKQSTIPKWIFGDKMFMSACLRGLIDTDGSLFRMSNKDFSTLRINFKNFNIQLLLDTRKLFLELGFNPSNIICGNCINLSRKSDVKRYIQEIGFSNKKHIKRLSNFTKISPLV